MIYRHLFIIALCWVAGLSANGQGVSNNNEDEVNKIDTRFAKNDFVPGQVLVKFKDANRVQIRRSQGLFASTNIDQVTSVLHKYGVSDMEQLLPNEKPNRQLRRAKAYNGDVIQEHDLSQLYCVKLSTEHQHETMQVVDELKGLEEVEFAEPNYRVYMMADTHIAEDYSGNPMETEQWYLENYGVKELWNKPIINNERPVIAILDTGVDITHPDLKDNLWTNTIEEYGTKDNDNDGNGFKNDVHGWDFVNNSSIIRDYNMHGTHVAGIAAAANNDIGIVGANPQALIMPITVLQSDGAGDVATIIKGINYAIQNGAKIINMSLGLYVNSKAFRLTLESAYGYAVLVAAAGNDYWSICRKHQREKSDYNPCFPAAYSFVLGVQATNVFRELATWSNYDDDGSVFSCETTLEEPDGFNYELKAPGCNILSTIPGGNYKCLSGTSMAAPLVAGAISALMMVKHFDTQEILWGDLLHNYNIAKAYTSNRLPELDLQKIVLYDRKDIGDLSEEDYSGDNEIDVGETVNIYPVIRNTFGAANNIYLKLIVDEFEDPNSIEIIKGEAFFGHLSAYGKGVSLNPLVVRIPNETVDNRHIRLKIVVTCDENSVPIEFPFTIAAQNMIKIRGLISENTTLTANHIYYVNGNLAINKGCTLTIEPGTRLEFAEGAYLKSFGELVANGTKEKPIIFTGHVGEGKWKGVYQELDGGMRSEEGYTLFCNNDTTLFTLVPTETTPITLVTYERYVYYGNEEPPTRLFKLSDYLGRTILDVTDRESIVTDPNFITPAVLKMFKDFNDYCDQYSSSPTEDKGDSYLVSCDFHIIWGAYNNHPCDTISFCIFNGGEYDPMLARDCVFNGDDGSSIVIRDGSKYTNYVNCPIILTYSYLSNTNYINNFNIKNGKLYSLQFISEYPQVYYAEAPSYLGTGREDLIRPFIYEVGNGKGTWGKVDLSNMPSKPFSEAHGVIWKVLVNGKDAQDEFEDLAPLGVGKHKFEVYFNRPMNKAVTPQISFGIREPYTQQSVVEEGSWNEEGTIYTAYKTITGKTNSDGLNRIYVYGAEDDDYFPCPHESTRFNVIVQAAGSMATGFAAEVGMGCVNLIWDNTNNDFEDAMGFNIFRYSKALLPAGWRNGTWHNAEVVNDTIRLNNTVLDIGTASYIDYDVEPGRTYYYYYEFLSSDLKVCRTSNVVAATPLTSTRGDANGSGNVDVADVISTVNYITKQNPQPFIFEAADINSDNMINILDVMGIVKGILDPSLLASSLSEGSATYIVEDGVLYVESDITLGGVQVQLTVDGRGKLEEIRVDEDLDGFEQASAWLSDNDYLFLAYSLNGKTLAPGRHALLHIGNAQIASLHLSDAKGRNVNAVGSNVTSISRMGGDVMNVDGIYDIYGRKIVNSKSLNSKLPHGIYIINGKKVVK